jgi:hypothetical protein
MSAKVRLSSKLPGIEETNGLDSIAKQLVDEPETIRLAVVWLDVSKVTNETDTGAHVPTVRVRRVEPIGDVGDVSDAIRKLVDEAQEARTGKTPLPLDVVDYEDETGGEL